MSDEPADDAPRYDLFGRDGSIQLVWRLTDRGVAIEPDGLVLMRAGRWTRAPFADFLSITLSSALIGRSSLALCTIRLRNGGRVVISNGNERGLPDGARDTAFRAFVATLHRHLVAAGDDVHIGFVSGFSATRSGILIGALVVGTALFVAGPLLLLIATGEIRALGLLAAGSLLIWPAIRVAKTNRPGSYNPDSPPDMVG